MPKINPWKNLIAQALKEDVGTGDVTTNLLIAKNQRARGVILLKEQAVLCGLDIAKQTFLQSNPRILFRTPFKDGASAEKGAVVATLNGPARSILCAERVALNFLGYLSGISTKTRAFVEAIHPYHCAILDTRKTTPGLRSLERYAVRCGGGLNHRLDLSAMVLVKDNHLTTLSAEEISQKIMDLKKRTRKKIEVEVESLKQFKAVWAARPNIILLDNMNLRQLREAVSIYRQYSTKPKPLLEVSGGVHLQDVRKIAQAGVHRISVGELTHSRKCIDFSLELKSL